ncbi:aldo/keto reductase [Pseudomonas sp. GM80]|jgi:aryl-alcohol dehydrogenase-like predicted oxidoreductase|uniref:aldo/keto reductase n=1 Tax=Pseudomonas sp. GM80 TaxID=1144339 RepID=UPI00026FB71D|nr:aldo/keto reductase [Pseudomonas sp. GM80]EJN33190.1 putative oxidoreductase, aryl-alcohol dehydrogenase like protein [Pseudomonas sp. GM80]
MNMPNFTPDNKQLVLGTALWGWGIDRSEAYALLEYFLAQGGQFVDTATNYPINKQAADFGLAVRWIADWVKSNRESNLKLIVKIGSRDNMGSPDIKLSTDDIEHAVRSLQEQFADTLCCISVHWDNRSDEARDSIAQTVQTLSRLNQTGLAIGLSGIKYPELYFKAEPTLAEKWIIQVKENFMTQKAREAYQTWFPNAKYLAYGINLGGLKSEAPKTGSSIALRNINISELFTEKLVEFINSPHEFNPRPTTLNELALAASYVNPVLSGIVIGPRNLEQLKGTLAYWALLEAHADKPTGLKVFDQLTKDLPSA